MDSTTIRNAELTNRIPSPISRGCDLPMVSFPRHLEVEVLRNVCLKSRCAARFSRAENICAFRRVLGLYKANPAGQRDLFSDGPVGAMTSPPSGVASYQELSIHIFYKA